MAGWVSIWLLLFGVCLSVLTSQASYMSWVLRCCSKGRRKADKPGNPNACNKDDLSRRRFDNPMDRVICRHAERICCVKTIQKRSCDLGKYNAYQGISCDTFKPYVGGDHFRECCDCCALGIKARADKVAVCTDFTLSPPCLEVFQDCCNGTTTVTPPTPTLGPIRKRRCSENFCQHLCRDSPTEGAVCFCRSGYSLQDDKTSCRDLDECQFGRDTLCGPLQRCVNTPGSFRCENQTEAACKLGRERLNGRCIDVDECARGTHRCGNQQKCNNNDGSYICTCKRGYQASGKNCFDIDECTSGQHTCSKEEQCENTEGSYKCVKSTECPPGTRYKEDRCEDIDECAGNPDICGRGYICSNTIGSYTCDARPACPSGQELVNGRCQVKKVDVCSSINCGSGFICNSANPGNPCQDIDECALSPSRCSAGESCVNFPGGFNCLDPCDRVNCGAGLKCKASGTSYSCEDIDECSFPPRKCTGDNEICVNRYRSYSCECRAQFRRNPQTGRCERTDRCTGANCPRGYRCVIIDENNFQCKDIDECSESPPKCASDQKCVNFPGGHYCTCRAGFRLNSITNTCQDIDECSEKTSGCNQVCENSPGSYACRCNAGYQMSSNGRTCTDVDECLQRTSRCAHTCENTLGSFVCKCRRGYELQSDGRSCADRNECDLVNCAYRCMNTGGSYRCVCPSGYNTTNFYCTDRNECVDGTAQCKEKEFCFNTYGSFRCIPKIVCPKGYNAVSDRRCDRSCREGDQACFSKKEQRFSLWTFKLRNMEPPSRIFSYRIVTYGYKKRPEVKYYFHHGNREGKFEIITQTESNGVFAYVRNNQRILGPKIFLLEFRGDVIDSETGDLASRFVHRMYVFVSRYDF